jgi:hypothetical protein
VIIVGGDRKGKVRKEKKKKPSAVKENKQKKGKK